MQNNQQITSVSQKDDQPHRPGNGGENEESVQSQSISSQSTPAQQTAFCDLSVRQENEFLSKGNCIRRFVKNPSAKRTGTSDSFASSLVEPDPNNNDGSNPDKRNKDNTARPVAANPAVESVARAGEHQAVYRSLSMEPAQAAGHQLPEELVAENLQQQATAGQANSLPTIQLSSEAEHDPEAPGQLPVKLNYRKSSDSTHKRTKSATKKATKNLLLNKEKLEEINAKINRTRSFNTPKKQKKSAQAKSHYSKHNQTSSRSSSIDSNLHIQVTGSPPARATTQQQLERQFEKRTRSKDASRCRHHRHRKSSARQLQFPGTATVSPLSAGLLSYSRSTEDIRAYHCSHSAELPPAVYLSNNGALLYTSGCFSSTSALAADSLTSAGGGPLQLHHSPLSANASLVPTSYLLLPDTSVCKNISLTPSPTYFSSYSAVPSYQTTPVHKHRHRSTSKSTRISKKLAASPIPDYLAVDFMEGARLTKSNSVRLSRADSKGSKCSKEHLCRKCRRKTSLNSGLRGQANYAEVVDSGKHYALPAASYSPSSQSVQQPYKSSSSSGGGYGAPLHLTDPLTSTVTPVTNPILLHNPLHLHPVVHSAAAAVAHDPITKSSSLNPAALGHIVSPVHLCQLNNLAAPSLTPVNPLLSQLTNAPSTLSVPDLSRLALNVTTATQPIQLQCTHMHPIPTVGGQPPAAAVETAEAKVSEAFTKLYRNKPAPDYFSHLFSSQTASDRSAEKPKLLDYLLTGADDLGKFLSRSSQLDNESTGLDKRIKLDAKCKSSSTESLNLKPTANTTPITHITTTPTTITTTTTTTTTTINDAVKQPAVIKKNFFRDKLNRATDASDKPMEKANDKDPTDKPQDSRETENRPGLANRLSVTSDDQSEPDKLPSRPLLEKRKTSNRHPMLNLLRKAQQTAEADAPPSFEPNKSLEQNEGDNKAINRLATAENGKPESVSTDRSTQEVKVEIECNKTKNEFITKPSVSERLASKSAEPCSASSEITSEPVQLDQGEQKPAQAAAPGRSRPFLMRMLASKKETKQLPTSSKSLEQPSKKASFRQAHHTVDVPQTQEEIAESTDELRALRTNLQKSGSITNGSKIAAFGRLRGSPSKEEITEAPSTAGTTSTSAMAKLRKKVSAALLRFLIYECVRHPEWRPNFCNYHFEISGSPLLAADSEAISARRRSAIRTIIALFMATAAKWQGPIGL